MNPEWLCFQIGQLEARLEFLRVVAAEASSRLMTGSGDPFYHPPERDHAFLRTVPGQIRTHERKIAKLRATLVPKTSRP